MTEPKLTPRRRRAGLAGLTAVAALTGSFVASALPTQPPRIQVGDTAPNFSLKTPDGTVHQLSELHDKQAVVLVFFRGVW